MRILGIDPGLATVGLGLIETSSGTQYTALDWLTITSKAGLPLPDRLKELHDDLDTFLEEAKPDLAVVEKLFFATNRVSAIEVAQARGVLILTLTKRGIPVIEATPLQLKLGITGDGKADKLQVQTMVKHMLKLSAIPKPDDAADGLALAMYGSLVQRESLIA